LSKGSRRQGSIPAKPRFRWNTSFTERPFAQNVLF